MHALVAATTAISNIAIGKDALAACTTGEKNVVVGSNAADGLTTANRNTAIGNFCMGNGTITGSNNTAVGDNALRSVTSGTINTVIGHEAGYNLTTGSNNLFLGHDAGTANGPSGSHTTHSNRIVLGDNDIDTFNCKVSLSATSDKRDKADITDFTKGLDIVNALRPVTYKWDMRSKYSNDLSVTPDGTHKKEKTEIGLIAQEVETIEKANGYSTDENNHLLITKSTDGLHYGLRYERLIPILVNAIKELSTKVTTLEAG